MMNVKFFSNDIFTCAGDPIHVIYSPVVGRDGTITLEESGKENTDDIIQSYAESCDLNVIISRYINGETEVLNRNAPSYGDFTEFPKTYAEVLQLQIDSNNLFNSLPVELKQKYDNDPNKFFVAIGSEEWVENLKKFVPDKTNVNDEKGETISDIEF